MQYIQKLIIDDAKNHHMSSLMESFKDNPQEVVETLNQYCPNFLHSYLDNNGYSNLIKYEDFYIDLIKAGYNYCYESSSLNISKDFLLFRSVGYGLNKLMKVLLQLGLNPNTKDDFQMDSFHNACINGNFHAAKDLYDNFDINIHSINFIGDNVFLSAIRYADVPMLKYLDSIGVDINYVNVAQEQHSVNQDALYLAVREGKIDMIQYLLTHPNYQLDSLDDCIEYAKKDSVLVFELLVEHKNILDEKKHLDNVISHDNLKKKVKI
jgi:ankyrin repeat protein